MACLCFRRPVKCVRVLQYVIPHIPLHAVDGHALIGTAAVALLLACMCADPGCNHGNGVGFHKDMGRSLHITFPKPLHISRYVRIGRTLDRTRCGVYLHAPEYGMVTVVSHNGIALFSALSHTVHPAADAVGIAVKPAAHILAYVASHGSHIAD